MLSVRLSLRLLIVVSTMMTITSGCDVVAAGRSGDFAVGIRIVDKHGVPQRHHGRSMRDSAYTWGAAAISVFKADYRQVTRITLADETYWFGTRRLGTRYRIGVSRRTGGIVEIIVD
jgi:hypothetical protein